MFYEGSGDMTGIQSYFLSVIAAGLVCSILQSLAGKNGTGGAVLKLTAGIFLSLTVLGPVVRLNFDHLFLSTEQFLQSASQAAGEGEKIAEETMSSIIMERTEAYILDKAKSMGVSLCVSVTLSPDTLAPVRVELDGAVSPYAKMRLQEMISDELGISKENQIWTG